MSNHGDLFRKLATDSGQGVSGLMNAYVQNFQEIVRLTENPLFRRNVVRSSAFGTALVDQAKAGAILNDISSLHLEGGKGMKLMMLAEEGLRKVCGTSQVSVNVSEEHFKLLSESGASLTFCIRDDQQDRAILEQLAPLIEGGLLFVEPQRALMYLGSTAENGQRSFKMLPVAQIGSAQQWETLPEKSKLSGELLDATSASADHQPSVVDVVLPYVAGTSSSDFVKIMQDEQSLLHEFRSSIRELVNSAGKEKRDTQAILHDIVNPKIARLERRFEQIAQMSRLKIGGAVVASATLALTSVLTGGIVAGAAALAGGTGLLMVTKEVAGRRADLEALKDDPVYLLWKMKRGPGV